MYELNEQGRKIMNRFPAKYMKPELISNDEGLNKGWSAVCDGGSSAQTGGCGFGTGAPAHGGGDGDGFIDPEILQQGL